MKPAKITSSMTAILLLADRRTKRFFAKRKLGHRLFEVDLQLTSDGYLVTRHDWSVCMYGQVESMKRICLSTYILAYYDHCGYSTG
ncbi:hypothetical protein VN24_15520 [Paenibacillus beijingensis]|uniref:GP-PDE domain-containing protein n=1 Tax=Paenibacillus beijingensis TaxID=1126833 RepID=A0A0D5NLB3_9BACL|nr:hypothetical protein VN24_15520 [Paenibacillus beijingensis]